MKWILGLTMILGVLNVQADELESLLGSGFGHDSVYVQVKSGGCTKKEDFEISKSISDGVTHISLRRTHEDPCFANLPTGVWLKFQYSELGLVPQELVRIANPTANFSIPSSVF